MNYAACLFLFLSSILHSSYPETLSTLLDQNYAAQAYWHSMTEKAPRTFFKRPPHKWFSRNWHSEVEVHLTALKNQEVELINLLADQITARQKYPKKEIQHLKKTYQTSLTTHGIPSHLTRRWLSYAGTAAACIGVLAYLHRFAQNHTLFVINPQAPSLLSALEDSSPFLGHDYVDKKGQQYLQVKKEQEALAHQFLTRHGVTYEKKSARFSLSWYNEKGETKISEFIYKHGVHPVREIISILKNEKPSKSHMFTTDVAHDTEAFEKRLTSLIEHAATIPETAPIVQNYLKGRPLEKLVFSEKRNIFTALSFHLAEMAPAKLRTIMLDLSNIIPFHEQLPLIQNRGDDIQRSVESAITDVGQATKELPTPRWYLPPIWSQAKYGEEVVEVLAPEFQKVLHTANTELIPNVKRVIAEGNHLITTANNAVYYISALSQSNPDLGGLIAEMIMLRALHINLQVSLGAHEVSKIADQSRLNMEISAMIPLMIAGFISYKTGSLLYKKMAIIPLITTLKHDLINLQLLCNKERNVNNPEMVSKRYQGLCSYWVTRLKRHTKALPKAAQPLYALYLQELGDITMTPQQKITVIECIFKDYDFLHDVS